MLRHSLLALMLAGAVVTSAASAVAQNNGGGDQQQAEPSGPPPGHGHGQGNHFDPERRTEMLTKQLNLTSDQQTKVLEILKSTQAKVQSLRSDDSTPPEERRSKMMEIRKGSDDQVRAVLDPNQQKKWDEMQSRHEHWRGQGPGGQAPSGPPDSSQPK